MSQSPQETPRMLWQPSPEFQASSNLSHFQKWLSARYGLKFADYDEIWKWSTRDLASFWSAVWEYFSVIHSGTYSAPLSSEPMPQTKWFQGVRLNYAENIFKQANDQFPAIISKGEDQDPLYLSWSDLESTTGKLQNFFKDVGLRPGDRVAAYLPNIPEATVAFLATCASGAVWSSTSPDFGTSSVIDRLAQIEPSILIGVDGYTYGGKEFSRVDALNEISAALPTVKKVIVVEALGGAKKALPNSITWKNALAGQPSNLEFSRVDFQHPIWILYSSGTTGLPKAITHSHGGVLLEHLKYLTFHNDVKPGEKYFWFTTTGWMMWNYLHASLLCGATIVLYNGSPAYPDLGELWRLSEEVGISHFGTSAGFIIACMKAGLDPGKHFDLAKLRSVGSTGSPLPPEGFDWIYNQVKSDLWLASISGGTDVCSAFVGGNPLEPVYSGEIQCRALGCHLEAFDPTGNPVVGQVGEMVITKPMPSMPIYFWNDPDFKRYQESYFKMYPGAWRHGDWTKINARGGIQIYGRSDSTLNRGGVRIGTSEIYRSLDQISEIQDSLIICLDKDEGEFYMPLFVVMHPSAPLDEVMKRTIKDTIRTDTSPRHVPDEILEVPEIPYTLSGKKVETPIKKILMGQDPAGAINPDALRNPQSMNHFLDLWQEGYFTK